MASLNSQRGPDDLDRFLRHIDHRVERWNHWFDVLGLSDLENYIDGNSKFAFEYSVSPDLGVSRNLPLNVTKPIVAQADPGSIEHLGEGWCLAAELPAGELFVISNWGGKPVSLASRELMNSEQKLVPSRFSVRLQAHDRSAKSIGDLVGQSVLYGFVEAFNGFAEGKLDGASLAVRDGIGRNDLEVGIVESGPEVLDDVKGDVTSLTYDAFVSFCVGGAVTSLLIRFENVAERPLFEQQLGELVDVFRGPVNLG
ncbi:hypothetical protein CN203_23705 [Sinorhizobium meliloti]|uniref:hypothetical protein n=1 Tax=Rhizobium meliloti TaxID=382 RepID=UPI000FD6DA49|nr:hypothetical protein [Sinorhizobium meliloti]RVH74287.1 hypothetical protein CN203_23705 [Sinorhizobium meliloti]